MPFTPTHIIAVVPFSKFSRWLPFSALAIGSMIPDLPLFFPVSNYATTHSGAGLFTVCLPLGVLVFVLFQYVVKIPAIALLPTWVQQRITRIATPLRQKSLKFYLFVSVAMILGAVTHIVWDAFTHQGRWGLEIFPLLKETVAIAGLKIPGYKLFQYGSTLVGIPLLSLHYFTQLRQNTPTPTRLIPYLSKLAKTTIISIFALIPVITTAIVFTFNMEIQQKVMLSITLSGAALTIAAIIYSALFTSLRFHCQISTRN